MLSPKTHISPRRAEALLFPIAAFLRAGGLSKETALKRLATAFDRSRTLTRRRRIEHIGNPVLYADVIALWGHDPRFLDRAGRARPLAIDEFSTLVRTVSRSADPRTVIRVLSRFGNVRRRSGGRYKLVRPLFFTSTPSAMAFEPMAFFLSDATATVGRILTRTSRTRGPEHFWRKVESRGITAADSRKFITFVNERAQAFLEELDDWLEAHARPETARSRRLRRVGLGLFSIDAPVEMADS